MPFDQKVFLFVVAALAIAIVLSLIFRPRRRKEVGDTHLDLSRSIGKLPALGVPYRVSRRSVPSLITLTPRHLEHVNILRRRDNRPPLNAAGFRTAIARQATAAEPRAVCSINDWVAYLIAYAVLSREHQQSRVACEHTIMIAPDVPFNGQGGRYGGAGTTSSFDTAGDPYADLRKAAIYGSTADPGPLHDGSLPPPGGAGYPGNDPQWSKQNDPPAAAPEPVPASRPDLPAYQAPDPPAYQAPDPPASGGTD